MWELKKITLRKILCNTINNLCRCVQNSTKESPIYTGVAAVLLYFESNKLYELRAEARNLVAQMQHSQPEHALQQLRDQLHSQRQIGWNS